MYPRVGLFFCRRLSNQAAKAIDPIQASLLQETCILVDEKDSIIGKASKEDCHKVSRGLPLHRAFSVFLFNESNELLLQRRSNYKITFPGHYTNSCCSHPLYSNEDERSEDSVKGVKLAAVRRLNYELGIPEEYLDPLNLHYITRILYKSFGDGIWGEYELDYVLFLKKNLPLKPNVNEVSEVKYVSLDNFPTFLVNLKDPLTPWFQLMVNHQLLDWWKNIDSLDKFIDHSTIHVLN